MVGQFSHPGNYICYICHFLAISSCIGPMWHQNYVIVNTPLPGLYVVTARVHYPDSPGRGVLTDL